MRAFTTFATLLALLVGVITLRSANETPAKASPSFRKGVGVFWLLIALWGGFVLAANAGEATKLIKAQDQVVAARQCQKLGYTYLARMSPQFVLCLSTLDGVPETLQVLAVEGVLKMAEDHVRMLQ